MFIPVFSDFVREKSWLEEKLLKEEPTDEVMKEPIEVPAEELMEAPAKEAMEDTAEEPMDMVLRRVDRGETARYELKSCFTEKVQWVSLETDQDGNSVKVRTPEEVTTICDRKDRLTVAGKTYPSFRSFLKKQDGEWGEDLYGRKVLCTKERFPCFDSYDYLYEHRYYRWYFIRKGNSISQVFVTDERDKVYVTEDVENVECWAWGRMRETGFCQPPKE